MRSIYTLAPRVAAVTIAIALLTVLGASSTLASETKAFTGQKICRQPFVTIAPPNQGGYCLVTASSLNILLGAKIYLTDPTFVAGVLDSPVTLKATDKRGSTATGHCTYHYPTSTTPGHGLCVYWAGTGRLAGFHATEVSGPPTAQGVSMTGTYWFDRDHEGDDDNRRD